MRANALNILWYLSVTNALQPNNNYPTPLLINRQAIVTPVFNSSTSGGSSPSAASDAARSISSDAIESIPDSAYPTNIGTSLFDLLISPGFRSLSLSSGDLSGYVTSSLPTPTVDPLVGPVTGLVGGVSSSGVTETENSTRLLGLLTGTFDPAVGSVGGSPRVMVGTGVATVSNYAGTLPSNASNVIPTLYPANFTPVVDTSASYPAVIPLAAVHDPTTSPSNDTLFSPLAGQVVDPVISAGGYLGASGSLVIDPGIVASVGVSLDVASGANFTLGPSIILPVQLNLSASAYIDPLLAPQLTYQLIATECIVGLCATTMSPVCPDLPIVTLTSCDVTCATITTDCPYCVLATGVNTYTKQWSSTPVTVFSPWCTYTVPANPPALTPVTVAITTTPAEGGAAIETYSTRLVPVPIATQIAGGAPVLGPGGVPVPIAPFPLANPGVTTGGPGAGQPGGIAVSPPIPIAPGATPIPVAQPAGNPIPAAPVVPGAQAAGGAAPPGAAASAARGSGGSVGGDISGGAGGAGASGVGTGMDSGAQAQSVPKEGSANRVTITGILAMTIGLCILI